MSNAKYQMSNKNRSIGNWKLDIGYLTFPKGFTLIELLVVITIAAILSTFAFANLLGARERARDTQRKSDLRQLQAAFELYRADQGAYPASLTACGTPLTGGGNTYMQKIPCDPTNSGQHIYTYVRSSSSTYQLFSCLENNNDAQKDTTNNTARCNGTDNWSYTLTNP